ncbi:MAG: DUF6056 family protein [Chitinophagaceae bacterium]
MPTSFLRSTFTGRIILLLPFFILFLLLVLTFFCYPSAEDLSIHYYNNTKGLSGNIRDFYLHDSSRYFSFPLLFLLFDGDFIITHYYIVPVLLLLSLWAAFYYLLRVICRYAMESNTTVLLLGWLSALLVCTFAAIAFDPATIFYWISGSVTYLPSFILFLLLTARLIKTYGKGKISMIDTILCIIYAICITGSNEISLCFLFAFLLFNGWLYYRTKRKINRLVVTLLIVQLICIVFLILPAGSGKRAHEFGSAYSLTEGAAAALLYTGRTFFNVLAEPLSWFILVIAFLAGNRMPLKIKEQSMRAGIRGIYFFLGALLVSFFFYFLIYFLSGELLPPRANSLVGFYVLIFLLLAVFFAGSRIGLISWDGYKHIRNVGGIAVIVIFLVNPIFANVLQNIFTGYLYHQTMMAREALIEAAKSDGEKMAKLEPYEMAVRERIENGSLGKLVNRFAGRLNKYPRLIHYMDPLADTSLYIHYYAEYRHIDSINYAGKMYKRIGLIPE